MLDIRHLRYFVCVVDMGSLSKAAGTLSISQPSLSQQVFAMEYQLGVPLLLRSASGVRPTDAGLKLYRHGRMCSDRCRKWRLMSSPKEGALSGR